MNHWQRKILKGALVAIVVTLLFPPFHIHAPNSIFGLGYGFLLSPPKFNAVYGTVDVPLLLAEWLAVGIICGILWVLSYFAERDRSFRVSVTGGGMLHE